MISEHIVHYAVWHQECKDVSYTVDTERKHKRMLVLTMLSPFPISFSMGSQTVDEDTSAWSVKSSSVSPFGNAFIGVQKYVL